MRKGRFDATFLLAVAVAGLLIGGGTSFVLSSLSTDLAFVIVVGLGIVLAIAASSARAARDTTESADDVRDATAYAPLERLVPSKKVAAADTQEDSEPG